MTIDDGRLISGIVEGTLARISFKLALVRLEKQKSVCFTMTICALTGTSAMISAVRTKGTPRNEYNNHYIKLRKITWTIRKESESR
jgi:hypothetical protein